MDKKGKLDARDRGETSSRIASRVRSSGVNERMETEEKAMKTKRDREEGEMFDERFEEFWKGLEDEEARQRLSHEAKRNKPNEKEDAVVEMDEPPKKPERRMEGNESDQKRVKKEDPSDDRGDVAMSSEEDPKRRRLDHLHGERIQQP